MKKRQSTIYKTPTFNERTARVPPRVNAAWLIQALRDNALAWERGEFLPWDGAGLDRRAAAQLLYWSGRK